MAFVVEDGTGLAAATSYVAVAYADEYFTDRGVAEWAGIDALKQGALIRATDYVDLRFGDWFQGTPTTEEQALAFPRTPWEGLPTRLLQAVCEYALRTLDGTALAPDLETDPSGQLVASRRERVDTIEEAVTFASASGGGSSIVAQFKPYPAADRLLDPLLINRGRLRTVRI